MYLSSVELKQFLNNELSNERFYYHDFRFYINKNKYYLPKYEETVKPALLSFAKQRKEYVRFYYNCINFSREFNAHLVAQNYNKDGLERPPIASAVIDCMYRFPLGLQAHALNMIIMDNDGQKELVIIEPQLLTKKLDNGIYNFQTSNVYSVFNIEFW